VNRSHRTRHPGALPGWGPAPSWGEPTGWSPLIDHGPLPLRAATSVARWWWPTLAIAGFLTLAGFVLGHDDPAPCLSQRVLVTITMAAAVVVLLTIRRAAGPGPRSRALAEYTVVALLAILLATTGLDTDQPPADGTQASAAPDRRQSLVKTLDAFRDWLAAWWQWADREYDRRTRPSSTTTKPKGQAMAPSPALPASTRRPL
jgi:hypothetical protein